MYRLLFSKVYSRINIRSMAAMGEKPLQLYSLATPNGQKIGIALEELGLEYDAHLVDISKDIQFGKRKCEYHLLIL